MLSRFPLAAIALVIAAVAGVALAQSPPEAELPAGAAGSSVPRPTRRGSSSPSCWTTPAR